MFSLYRWLGRCREPVLGVDIGSTGIHLVELAADAWPLQLRHLASEPLPLGALRDACIVDPQVVSDALRRAVRASGTRLRSAALALPATAVMKKLLTLPQPLHEDDLEAEIDAEAAASLSFSREEIGIDFSVLRQSIEQPGFVDVMLVAARRERIDERVEVALAAGLKPRIVDIESHALAAVIRLAEAERMPGTLQPVAVIQVDAERSHCLFLLGDELLLERDLGQAPGRRDVDATAQFCAEFVRVVQLFCASTAHSVPAHLYLTGEVPPELPGALAKAAGTGVTVPDPQLGMTGGLDRISPKAQARISACLLACGLALRSYGR